MSPSRTIPCCDRPGHAGAPRPRAVHHHDLVAQLASAERAGPHEARERDRAGPLDVVVERGQPLAIPVEDVERRVLRQVFPLHDGPGPARPDRLDHLIGLRQVLGPAQAPLAEAQVRRAVEQVLAVGADVEPDGQRPVGADAASDRVEDELPDRDRQTSPALVADAEDGRRVGRDDDAHVVEHAVLHHLRGPRDIARREREPSRAAIDRRGVDHRVAHGRRVDDGEHLGEVLLDERVKQDLVSLLETPQVRVLRERRRLALEGDVRPLELLVDRRDVWRQEPVEAEGDALVLGERRALVGERQPGQRSTVDSDEQLFAAALVPKDLKVPRNSCHREAKVRTGRGLRATRGQGPAGPSCRMRRGAEPPGAERTRTPNLRAPERAPAANFERARKGRACQCGRTSATFRSPSLLR